MDDDLHRARAHDVYPRPLAVLRWTRAPEERPERRPKCVSLPSSFPRRRGELAAAADPEGHLAEIKDRLNRVRSPFRSAEFFEIEDIIEPASTRSHLCHWANLAYGALQPGGSQFGYRP